MRHHGAGRGRTRCVQRAGFTECEWPSCSPAGTRDPMPALVPHRSPCRGNSCSWGFWPWCPRKEGLCGHVLSRCSAGPGPAPPLGTQDIWPENDISCCAYFAIGPTEVPGLMVDSRHFPGISQAVNHPLPSGHACRASPTTQQPQHAWPGTGQGPGSCTTCHRYGPMLQGSPSKILAMTVFALGHHR